MRRIANNMWPFHKHKFKIEAITYTPPRALNTTFKCAEDDTATKFLNDRERAQSGLTTFVYRCQDENCCAIKVIEALGKITLSTINCCEEKDDE